MDKRRAQSGVTLVEVLVVLVLIGTLAGAVSLSIGALDRGKVAKAEASTLQRAFMRATDTVVATGVVVRFDWDETSYAFSKRLEGTWQPLDPEYALPDGLRLRVEDRPLGDYVLTPALLPAQDQPLKVTLGLDSPLRDPNAWSVVHNGFNATLLDPTSGGSS